MSGRLQITVALFAAVSLSGCGGTAAIYKALKYSCPDRAVPRPAALDKEPETLSELRAKAKIATLTVDTWEKGYEDCAE